MDRLPQFDVASTLIERLSHDQVLGRPSIFYFYPKDSTPGCTRESEDFAAAWPELQRRKVQLYGVSRDSLRSHENFQRKYGLPFPLIADTDETLCTAFGVIGEKLMYGRQVRGIVRSSFLFDAAGALLREWRKVKVPGHVDAVLEAVRELPDLAD
jgi:peroxiredoxin Q/BCP